MTDVCNAMLCTKAKDREGDVKLAVFRKVLALYGLGYIFTRQNTSIKTLLFEHRGAHKGGRYRQDS